MVKTVVRGALGASPPDHTVALANKVDASTLALYATAAQLNALQTTVTGQQTQITALQAEAACFCGSGIMSTVVTVPTTGWGVYDAYNSNAWLSKAYKVMATVLTRPASQAGKVFKYFVVPHVLIGYKMWVGSGPSTLSAGIVDSVSTYAQYSTTTESNGQITANYILVSAPLHSADEWEGSFIARTQGAKFDALPNMTLTTPTSVLVYWFQ